jgi:uncharacterized RDD family membrane protein YckC
MAARPVPVLESVDDSADRELMTGEAVALDVRATSFILQAAGAAIDWCVSAALFLGLVLLILFVGGASIDTALETALVTASLVFSIVVTPIAFELGLRGRSLGRLAVGARIVRDDGGAIQFRHAFVRALLGVVEIYLTFGGLAAITGLLNSKSKRLGDLLAGTFSQYERVPHIVETAFGVPPALTEWAATADVAKLPDRLSRRVAAFLSQAAGFTSAARFGLAAELAAEASRYVSPIPAVDAETFLAGVAAVRRDRDFSALMLERERLSELKPILASLPHGFPDR